MAEGLRQRRHCAPLAVGAAGHRDHPGGLCSGSGARLAPRRAFGRRARGDEPAVDLVFAGRQGLRAARTSLGALVSVLCTRPRKGGTKVALGVGPGLWPGSGDPLLRRHAAGRRGDLACAPVPRPPSQGLPGVRRRGGGRAGVVAAVARPARPRQMDRQLSASDRLFAVPQHFVVGLSVPGEPWP